MTRKAVLICPGRGSYNKPELGYLSRHHGGDALAPFDALRQAAGQVALTALDTAPGFDPATHLPGGNASGLIYAATVLDAGALAQDIEIVAVTGNSMGWYSTLAVGGALSVEDGFTVVNTMGALMEAHGPGGQVILSVSGEDWRPDPARRAAVLDAVAEIGAREGQALGLSIDLGGTLVLAGDAAGLAALEQWHGAALPRLPHHAAFHTDLVAPVVEMGRAQLAPDLRQPRVPLIDGRGAISWPGATRLGALWDYTLGHQVVRSYNFAHAIATAAREFAPDLFILTGPGGSLGGAVAQSLIAIGWTGITDKPAFQARQAEAPILISMGRAEQRALVT